MTNRRLLATLALLALLCSGGLAGARAAVTTPREHLGFGVGDDYQLASYTQLVDYWRKLDKETDRVSLAEIGQSAEGRPMWMAVVTSPRNQRRLGRYREIARRLALAEEITEAQARDLAREGKAVVWIDGGLHATETLGAQQLIELVYQMASQDDPETTRILDDVVLLAVCANPDGMELVANWYLREPKPEKRSLSRLPRLYQKYTGHDNNRDFYMVTQPETEAICRVFYQEWFPQIVYNHHQSGPAGTVLFAPPFRDPFNYCVDPLIPLGIDQVGAAMHARFAAEGKPGATMRSGASYSTWWNGGLRTTAYFHNMIGLLTETIGSPNPSEIPFSAGRVLPRGDLPYPIEPQKWRFRQSIDYSVTADRAVLDYASRHREDLLLNIWRMGRNSIERGSRDHWTMTARRFQEIKAALDKKAADDAARKAADDAAKKAADDAAKKPAEDAAKRAPGGETGDDTPDEPEKETKPTKGPALEYLRLLRDPARRDPRGYILPSDQPDFPTATHFVNALIKNGITIHRATRAFEAAGKTYPAGSYVAMTAQAFRPHVLDMFEPQHHPDDVAYPGGPPTPPYDVAGWTLAYQMGVVFDRVLDGFDGPFEKIAGLAKTPAGTAPPAPRTRGDAEAAPPAPRTRGESDGTGEGEKGGRGEGVARRPETPADPMGSAPPAATTPGEGGYLLSHAANNAFVAVNRLLRDGEEVYWLQRPLPAGGKEWPAGTFFIPARVSTPLRLKGLAEDLGVTFAAVDAQPTGEAGRLRPPRVGLCDRYGGSISSGWTRWVLEQFEFPFTLVYPPTLDAGDLAAKFDVLVFPTGAIPARDAKGAGGKPNTAGIPEEYHAQLGSVTVAKSVPQIRRFLEDGGTVICVGSATCLGTHLEVPLRSALVERLPDGSEKPLGRDRFYIPGSILQVRLNPAHPLACGIGERLDVVFVENTPVFRMSPEAAIQGVAPVAWFDNGSPLRSGWALGQKHLQDGIAVLEAGVGKGKLILLGPEVTFRAQSHASFKLLFNGILYGPSEVVELK